MGNLQKSAKRKGPRKRATRAGALHLERLIAEATVDCYNESEEIAGIFTMLEEELAVPFMTKLLGVEVTVERVDLNDAGEIVAVCRRGREHQRIPVLDLPLPERRPRGAEWIDAYRRWAQGR
ncbi:MAG: calcium-binding protein [Proteobacteria bacterium]|nr:calcium-binding protein [Pseudomonadota bacterium]